MKSLPMPHPSLPWRSEFLAALRLLARVSGAMAARGLPRPVLLGGGAMEFYTGSALMTGDIDVTSPVQPELEEELQRHGFVVRNPDFRTGLLRNPMCRARARTPP
jgi:hypothetical protein